MPRRRTAVIEAWRSLGKLLPGLSVGAGGEGSHLRRGRDAAQDLQHPDREGVAWSSRVGYVIEAVSCKAECAQRKGASQAFAASVREERAGPEAPQPQMTWCSIRA